MIKKFKDLTLYEVIYLCFHYSKCNRCPLKLRNKCFVKNGLGKFTDKELRNEIIL